MASKKPAEVEVIVTVSGERLADTKDISEKLRDRGMTISNVLERTGMIVGSGSEAILGDLKAESGVAAVESAGRVQLAPPGSDVQ